VSGQLDVNDTLLVRQQAPAGGLLDQIAEKLSRFVADVVNFERMIKDIGSHKDNGHFRSTLKAKREETTALSKEIKAALKSMVPQGAEKARIDKLMTQFADATRRFQLDLDASMKREGQHQLVADIGGQEVSSASPPMQLSLVETGDVDQRLVQERNEAVKHVAEDLKELTDVFTDVAGLVHEQGDMLNTTYQNVEGAAKDTDIGVKQLEKALVYQNKSRRKLFCIAIVVFIMLTALGIFLGIYLGVLRR